MNVSAYFARIGLPGDFPVSHTYAFLREVQYHHVTTVPYENLDILDGRPLSLRPEDLFDKIVTRHRGGYCFEVNGALSALLKELGFPVKNYFARFLRGETTVPVRRHRVLAVTAEDGVYLCDTGIGQSAPRWPVKLEEGTEQHQFGETYRFRRDPFLGWVLCDLHKGQWRDFFSFTEEEQLDIDFDHSSFWCEHAPDSPFNKAPMLSIKTADGRKTVDGREYKIFCGDEVILCETDMSDARLSEVLRTEFGLDWQPAP